MKIGIVGANQIYSIENFYVKYFKKLNVRLEVFTAPVLFREYYKSSIWNKVFFKLGVSSIYTKINYDLKKWIANYKPDVLWVFKGMEIFPATLQWAKDRGIKTVNYNPDNPFIFSGRGSGNSNITNSIDLYDLHYTYHPEVRTQLEKRKKSKVAILPFGFDLTDDVYQRCITEEEIKQVCFLGNPDKERTQFIISLAEDGVPIAVYGHAWDKHIKKQENIFIHSAVYGEDQWKVLRRYRVQLNLMRPHNIHSHNMRTFEVPAVGGIMLAPNTLDHQHFFEDGKECFLFSDIEQAAQQANRILNFSFDDAMQVREAARNRSLNSGYSYFDRAKQALNEIKNIHA